MKQVKWMNQVNQMMMVKYCESGLKKENCSLAEEEKKENTRDRLVHDGSDN